MHVYVYIYIYIWYICTVVLQHYETDAGKSVIVLIVKAGFKGGAHSETLCIRL